MKTLIAALVLISSVAAFGQTARIVSIDAFDLSYTGGLAFKKDKGELDNDETLFRLNLNYAQNLEQYVGLMWKARVHINREDTELEDTDGFFSQYGAAGGLLYNFQYDDVKNSFLAGAMAGIERMTIEALGNDDKSGWNLFLELEGGKRWDLGQYSVVNISYAPTVAWTYRRYGGDLRDDYFDSGHEFRFNFLKFDILF